MSKKLIISVSYGADEAAMAQDIGLIEDRLRNEFPDFEIRRAFTSARVRRVLASKGTYVPSPSEAVFTAKGENASEIIAVAMLVSPGGEFDSVTEAAAGIPTASPLLAEDCDIDTICGYYKDLQQESGIPVLIMGHGNPDNGNPAYKKLRARLPEHVYMGCLSGDCGIDEVLPELLSENTRRVLLTPMLMSVGSHTLRDMAGDQPDSWKSRLESLGFTVDCMVMGIGRLEQIHGIFVRKLKAFIHRD